MRRITEIKRVITKRLVSIELLQGSEYDIETQRLWVDLGHVDTFSDWYRKNPDKIPERLVKEYCDEQI